MNQQYSTIWTCRREIPPYWQQGLLVQENRTQRPVQPSLKKKQGNLAIALRQDYKNGARLRVIFNVVYMS